MVPFAILAISIILLLVWQSQAIAFWQSMAAASHQPGQSSDDNATLNQFLTWQSKLIDGQRATTETAKTKLEDYLAQNIPKLDADIKKSEQTKTATTELAKELLELAKTDPDAKFIVQKYGITQANPPDK